MLRFRTDYLQAMRDRAPAMFNELRRCGAMNSHLDQKAEQARELYAQVTRKAEMLPSGALANPQEAHEAREQVYATLTTFPPSESAQPETETETGPTP